MGFPKVDREALAQGTFALKMILMQMSSLRVLMLGEIVPERGEALWLRFTTWRDAQAKDTQVGFADWFKYVLSENMMTALYPRGCTLDGTTRRLLSEEVMRAIGARTDEDFAAAHFGVDPQYGMVRAVACKGCPVSSCPHFLDPFRSRQATRPVSSKHPTRPVSGTDSHQQLTRDEVIGRCRNVLRDAPDKELAKQEIKRVLRTYLPDHLRQAGNSVTVSGSDNPKGRRASVYLNGDGSSMQIQT